ncbi:hypothetical protein IWZ00DRAFT_197013 [Phyllosticta capitalensis]
MAAAGWLGCFTELMTILYGLASSHSIHQGWVAPPQVDHPKNLCRLMSWFQLPHCSITEPLCWLRPFVMAQQATEALRIFTNVALEGARKKLNSSKILVRRLSFTRCQAQPMTQLCA